MKAPGDPLKAKRPDGGPEGGPALVEALRAFVYRVAYEPVGHPEATHQDVLDTLMYEARELLARLAPEPPGALAEPSGAESARVRVGQQWREKDKRANGRVVEVFAVDEYYATVGHPTIASIPRTKIQLRRLPKAFMLVRAAPEPFDGDAPSPTDGGAQGPR